MCLSCACDTPGDDHGDPRNITIQNIYDAAAASHCDADTIVNNIENYYAREVDHDFQDVDDIGDDS